LVDLSVAQEAFRPSSEAVEVAESTGKYLARIGGVEEIDYTIGSRSRLRRCPKIEIPIEREG